MQFVQQRICEFLLFEKTYQLNFVYYQTCIQLCCPWGYSHQPNPDYDYELAPNEPTDVCLKDDELEFMFDDIKIPETQDENMKVFTYFSPIH